MFAKPEHYLVQIKLLRRKVTNDCQVLMMMHTVTPIRRKSAVETALLIQVGEQVRRARHSRHLTATSLAKRIGVPRNSLRAVECGEPTVSIRTYVNVLLALGLVGEQLPLGANAFASSATLARRHEALEAQVVAGLRDARSLVSIPARMAEEARVIFPKDAFGKPEPW